MKQLELENMDVGVLPDGTQIREGDILMYDYGPYRGQVTRAVLFDGKLCMESNFMFGDNVSISHFLNAATYAHIRKITLAELYKHCKKNNWETAKYMVKYRK